MGIKQGLVALTLTGLAVAGCGGGNTSAKQLAISALETHLSGKYATAEVLTDSTYSLTFTDDTTKTYRMSLQTSTNDSGAVIYQFNLHMLPSFVEIKVTGDSAEVTDHRP